MLKAFLSDMLAYLPSKLLPALTGFITAPILTRLFLPAEYGRYALALGLSDLLFALTCSGFGAGVIRFFPAYKVQSELHAFFATLSVSIGVTIAAASAVSFSALVLLRGHLPDALYPLLLISILVFVAQAVFTVFLEVMRAQERSGSYTVFELATLYGGLGLGLLLVIVFAFRVEGLLWGTFIALALALPFLIALTTKGVGPRPQHFRLPDAMQMWRYAWPLALGNIGMWGLRLSDRYIIASFRPESEVGLYSAAYNISGKSIDMIVALFMLTMGPMVMNTWETQGREATEKSLAMITRLFLILCLPAVVGLGLLARPTIALLTGRAYHEGHRIVAYVALASFMWGLSGITDTGLLISKATRRLATNQIIAAAINLGLNLLLVPHFGFVAAGFATLVGYAALFALQTYASRRYLTWRFPFRTLWNAVVATACMGLAVRGFPAVLGNRGDSHLAHLLLSIAVAVPVYLGSLLLLGEASEEETARLRRLWHGRRQ